MSESSVDFSVAFSSWSSSFVRSNFCCEIFEEGSSEDGEDGDDGEEWVVDEGCCFPFDDIDGGEERERIDLEFDVTNVRGTT